MERVKFGIKKVTSVGTNEGHGNRLEGEGMEARHYTFLLDSKF